MTNYYNILTMNENTSFLIPISYSGKRGKTIVGHVSCEKHFNEITNDCNIIEHMNIEINGKHSPGVMILSRRKTITQGILLYCDPTSTNVTNTTLDNISLSFQNRWSMFKTTNVKSINLNHFLQKMANDYKINNVSGSIYFKRFYGIQFEIKTPDSNVILKLYTPEDVKQSLVLLLKQLEEIFIYAANIPALKNIAKSLSPELTNHLVNIPNGRLFITDVLYANAWIKNFDPEIIDIYNNPPPEYAKFRQVIKDFRIDNRNNTKIITFNGLKIIIKDKITIPVPPFVNKVEIRVNEDPLEIIRKIAFAWLTFYNKLDDFYAEIELAKLKLL